MTVAHRLARVGDIKRLRRVIHEKPELANMATFPSRAPGLYTPLMCLADAPWNTLVGDDGLACADLLVQAMSGPALQTQSVPKRVNWAHLAAARGNIDFLTIVCAAAAQNYGREVI